MRAFRMKILATRYNGNFHYDSSSLCALADGLSAHRQRAHLHLQLALCAPQRRHHDPAHRRYRCRAQHRGLASIPSSTVSNGSAWIGTSSTGSPSVSRSTGKWPTQSCTKDSPIAISRPRIRARPINRGAHGAWLFQSRMREISREESDRRAAAGEPFVLRFRVPRDTGRQVRFHDLVYGEQSKSTADIEDFALLRSDGMPTYHLGSCADDADLRISHIMRGQDHLTNTFKHVLIFEAAGRHAARVRASAAAGRARWRQAFEAQARPGGQRHHLSRRRISAGSLHQFPVPARLVAQERPRTDDAPGTDRRVLVRRHQPQQRRGQFHGRRPVRSESRWLNAEHIRTMPAAELAERLLPWCEAAGFTVRRETGARSRR